MDFLNQEYITHGARNSDSILVDVNVFLIDSILVSELEYSRYKDYIRVKHDVQTSKRFRNYTVSKCV